MAAKKRAPRRKKTAAKSIGLAASETSVVPSQDTRDLAAQADQDGGTVLGSYRDPFGGGSVMLVALPIDLVEPTPYQRDPSDAHVKRLMTRDRKGRPLPRSHHPHPARRPLLDAKR